MSGRVVRHFAEAKLEWTREVQLIQARSSSAGYFGGTAGVFEAIDAFEPRLKESVSSLLAEVAKNERGRRRTWRWAHSEIERQLNVFDDVPMMAVGMMWRGPSNSAPDVSDRFGLAMANAKADIAAHAAEWTAPDQLPIPQRYPVAFPIAMLVVGAIIGALVDPLKSAIPTLESCVSILPR